MNVPDGGVAWPYLLLPQQASVPSVRIAQVWFPPALTAMYVPDGGVAWPQPSLPQQASVPSVAMAQVWRRPRSRR